MGNAFDTRTDLIADILLIGRPDAEQDDDSICTLYYFPPAFAPFLLTLICFNILSSTLWLGQYN